MIQPEFCPLPSVVLHEIPFTRHTTCCQSGCQTGFTTGWTTGCIMYTNIQPVVKPVVKPVVSSKLRMRNHELQRLEAFYGHISVSV